MTETAITPTRLGYELVDADNHYYEPYDAFTRHIVPAFADRAINVQVDAKGRGKLYFGDRQFRYMRVIQTDYIGAPGSLREMLDDMDNQEGFVHKEIIRGWDYPDMMQRAPRIELMNAQGVRGGLMLGTMMLQAENEMHDDIPALYANIRSYNKWLDEEWGFNRDGRIVTAPMISLLDPILESVVTLAAVAAVTERVALGPCVMLFGLRQPLVLAKQLGTLAAFAPGRLRVGVGVGGEYPAEFEAAGVPLAERGKRMETVLSDVRALAPRYELRDIDFGPSFFVRGPESGVVTLGT